MDLDDRERIEELYWEERDTQDGAWKLVRNRIVGHGRWSVIREKVFEEKLSPDVKGIPRILILTCGEAATEYQEHCPVEARWGKKTVSMVEDYV